MYIGDENMINLLNQRNKRLQELESDWGKIRKQLYMFLEINYCKEIEMVKDKNPSLLKKEFCWTKFYFIFNN